MKRLLGVGILSAAMIAGNVSFAMADCMYGSQALGGSINGGRTDTGRFYTSNGGSMTISIEAQNGPLRVMLPGCGWSTGTSHSCTMNAGYGAQVHPTIVNPNPFTVTYTFSCD